MVKRGGMLATLPEVNAHQTGRKRLVAVRLQRGRMTDTEPTSDSQIYVNPDTGEKMLMKNIVDLWWKDAGEVEETPDGFLVDGELYKPVGDGDQNQPDGGES